MKIASLIVDIAANTVAIDKSVHRARGSPRSFAVGCGPDSRIIKASAPQSKSTSPLSLIPSRVFTAFKPASSVASRGMTSLDCDFAKYSLGPLP